MDPAVLITDKWRTLTATIGDPMGIQLPMIPPALNGQVPPNINTLTTRVLCFNAVTLPNGLEVTVVYIAILFLFRCLAMYRSYSNNNIHHLGPYTIQLHNLNFNPLEVVSRYPYPQLQVCENLFV